MLADWKNDEPASLKMMIDYDFNMWAVNRLINLDMEYKSVIAFFRRRSSGLKNLFNALVESGDHYPRLGYHTFISFCKATGIIEEPDSPITTPDKARKSQTYFTIE